MKGYLWGLYSAADTIRGLLEVVQPVPKSDAVLSSPPVSPVQHQGQQFVLGQVNHGLGTQVMHAGTSLSLENMIQGAEKAGIAFGLHVKLQMVHLGMGKL